MMALLGSAQRSQPEASMHQSLPELDLPNQAAFSGISESILITICVYLLSAGDAALQKTPNAHLCKSMPRHERRFHSNLSILECAGYYSHLTHNI